MRFARHALAAGAIAFALAGCGTGNDGKPTYSRVVSFGDSLSDVGTYSVGTVKALGGGKYTINDPANTIWIENVATAMGLTKPCAAMTGLDGDATQGFKVTPVSNRDCFGYAQGGARVTNPVGPGNKLLGGANATLGQLTVPVVTQIANHLSAVGGRFSGNEAVFVLAGGNDVFINLAQVGTALTPTQAVAAMGTAGAELAGYVKNQIVGNGANYVVVVNLPDVSKTPFAYAQAADTQALISQMSSTFNDQLGAGLAGLADRVLLVDAYTLSRTQAASPAAFGIANNTSVACNLSTTVNPLQSSLVCTRQNLVAGDPSRYQFADTVHPTPFGHTLISDAVRAAMIARGWL